MDFKLKLLEKRDEAKGTKTFIFEKPQGFTYKAGQYMYWTLPELRYPDSRGNIRHFTLSSSPTEDFLSITIRLREESGYKKPLPNTSLAPNFWLEARKVCLCWKTRLPPRRRL